MENEHISIEEMEEVAYFSGRLDSEEGKRFQEKAGRLNSHILRCEDCRNIYREIMEKTDREKGMPHKKSGEKRLYDEIFNQEGITDICMKAGQAIVGRNEAIHGQKSGNIFPKDSKYYVDPSEATEYGSKLFWKLMYMYSNPEQLSEEQIDLIQEAFESYLMDNNRLAELRLGDNQVYCSFYDPEKNQGYGYEEIGRMSVGEKEGFGFRTSSKYPNDVQNSSADNLKLFVSDGVIAFSTQNKKRQFFTEDCLVLTIDHEGKIQVNGKNITTPEELTFESIQDIIEREQGIKTKDNNKEEVFKTDGDKTNKKVDEHENTDVDIEEKIEKNDLMSEIEEYIPDVETKSTEELAKELIQLQDASLDKVYWVETVERDNPSFSLEKMPILNNPISRREILLSKLIGKPYPTYFLDGVMDDKHDKYRNEIRKPRTEDEIYTVGKYEYDLKTNQSIAREEDDGGVNIDAKEVLEFGYDRSGDKMPGSIEVSVRDLWRAGLSNERMGIADPQVIKTKISSRDIAEADKETSLTKTEVGGIKNLINKIREFFKGKGEK